jgi:hypothetical protein
MIRCHSCGALHPAEISHESPSQGTIYAVVCPEDWLTDYYTREALEGPHPR